jgi:lipopolysaccharide/colanic/teichoic acid biosynthesis glycosyltransferase
LPVLFTQCRVGRYGRLFKIYKFRKFRKTAHNESMITLPGDIRFTRVGKTLDSTKINELPQLLNVLRGDMAVVGPRPEVPKFHFCFRGRHAALLNFKPGLFGPSQTKFRNEANLFPADRDPDLFYARCIFPQKADLDLQYYGSATLASDCVWIIRSLRSVALGTKAPPQMEPQRQGNRRVQ